MFVKITKKTFLHSLGLKMSLVEKTVVLLLCSPFRYFYIFNTEMISQHTFYNGRVRDHKLKRYTNQYYKVFVNTEPRGLLFCIIISRNLTNKSVDSDQRCSKKKSRQV